MRCAKLVGLASSLLICLPSFAAETITWTGCGITKKAFMAEMAAAYKKETGVEVKISGGGATKGIRATSAGNSDIGGSCRHLIVDPNEKDVRLWPVAWDAVVVVVHKSNPIENITHSDLQKVFKGQIKDWKELGGKPGPIDVFIRNGKISGVGMMARELVFGDMDVDFKATKTFKSTGPLETALEAAPNAIALDGISSAKKRDIKIIKVNGVEPTVDKISSGDYILFRPLYLVTKSKPSKGVQGFIDYVQSKKGQQVIASQGTVNLEQGKRLWGPYRQHMAKVKGGKKGIFE